MCTTGFRVTRGGNHISPIDAERLKVEPPARILNRLEKEPEHRAQAGLSRAGDAFYPRYHALDEDFYIDGRG